VADAQQTRRVIKRYANRKLYDSALRRFTSLVEIKRLVRAGVDVQVVDHDTGEDVTEDSLAQIVGTAEVGLNALSTLIRMPSRITQALVDDDSQAAEIRELRSQVEQLTQAVSALLAERDQKPTRKKRDG
jgi:polyhydroxyalkanoate synthesis repressor PhaR